MKLSFKILSRGTIWIQAEWLGSDAGHTAIRSNRWNRLCFGVHGWWDCTRGHDFLRSVRNGPTNGRYVYIYRKLLRAMRLWWCITAHLFEERICNRHLQDHWKWSTNASNRCLTPSPFVKADGRHTFPKSWACRQNFYHTSHPKKKQQKQFPHQVSKIKIQIWKTTFNWQIEKRTWNFPPKTQSPPRS